MTVVSNQARGKRPAPGHRESGDRSRLPARDIGTSGPVSAVIDLGRLAGNAAVGAVVTVGGGTPMDDGVKREMESRFNSDFSGVRIHDDHQAHAQASALSAKAFTSGEHIVFGDGHYDPQRASGRDVLAHELAHVIQQRRGGGAAPRQDGQGPLETDAHNAAQAAVAGSGPIAVAASSAPGVACTPDDEEKKKEAEDPVVKAAVAKWKPDMAEGGPLPATGALKYPPPDPARRLKSQELHAKRREFEKKRAEQQAAGGGTADVKVKPPTVPAKLRKQLNEEKEAGQKADALKHDALVQAQDPMSHEDMLNKVLALRAFESSVGVGALEAKRAAYTQLQQAADAHPGNAELVKLQADRDALDKTIGPLERRQAKQTLTQDEQKQLVDLEKKRTALRDVINNHPATVAHNKANALYNKLAISTLQDPADPSKESPGALAGRGEHTYVVIQVIGKDGKLLAVGRGRNAGGLHAEDVALAEIDTKVDAKQLAGARLEVVGDQVVCSDKCFVTLGQYKKDKNLTSVRAIVFREQEPDGTEKAPRTTAQGATLKKDPGTMLVKEVEEIDSSIAVADRQLQRKKTPPQPAAAKVKAPGVAEEPPETPPAITPTKKATAASKVPPAESAPIETEAQSTPSQVPKPEETVKQEQKAKPAPKKREEKKTAPAATPGEVPAREQTPRAGARISRSVQTEFGERVRVTYDESYGAIDKPFRVTTAITLNVGGSGAIEAERRGSVSGNVSASGRLTISFSRLMSRAEKEQHQQAIGGRKGGATTELQIVELIASGDDASAGRLLQQVRDAYRSGATTTRRSEGEFVEIDLEGTVAAGIGASRGGIGAHVQRSEGAGLRQRILFSGGKDVITVTGTRRSTGSVGGSAGFGGGAVGYTATEGTGRDASIEFTLDPEWKDFEPIRRTILDAGSLEELQAIAAAARANHPALVTGGSLRNEVSSGSDSDVTLLGFGFRFQKGGALAEETEQRGSQLFRTVTGSGTTGVAVVGPAQQVQVASTTDTLRGTVGPENTVDAVTQSEASHLDVGKSIGQLRSQLQAHFWSTVVSVARGDKRVLQERVDTTGKVLDEASIARVLEVANDEVKWQRAWNYAGVSGGALFEWERTRQKVLAAKGDRYAILKALAEWEAGAGGRSGDVERLAGATGAAFEFSDENADQRAVYEALVARDPATHARQLAQAGDPAGALKEYQALYDRLGLLADNIRQHQAGTTPGKLNEMLRLTYGRREAIRGEMAALAPADVARALPDALSPAERSRIGQRIDDLIALCSSNRRKEQQIFARIEDELDTSYLSSTEYAAVRRAFDSLDSVYGGWDKAIDELKTLRASVGLSPDAALEVAPDRQKRSALLSHRFLRRIQE